MVEMLSFFGGRKSPVSSQPPPPPNGSTPLLSKPRTAMHNVLPTVNFRGLHPNNESTRRNSNASTVNLNATRRNSNASTVNLNASTVNLNATRRNSVANNGTRPPIYTKRAAAAVSSLIPSVQNFTPNREAYGNEAASRAKLTAELNAIEREQSQQWRPKGLQNFTKYGLPLNGRLPVPRRRPGPARGPPRAPMTFNWSRKNKRRH